MTLPGKLRPIVEAVAARLEARRQLVSASDLAREAEASAQAHPGRRAAFAAALRAPGLSVIAEHKRRSPSEGPLSRRGLQATLRLYAKGGAAAFSILTEEDHFAGNLTDLAQAAALRIRPCLRKDFLLDASMVHEARIHGASAVLLLACLHEPAALQELVAAAHAVDLAVLLEVHEPGELAGALQAAPDALGVNARDLRTFDLHFDRALALLGEVPPALIRVAESAVEHPAQAAQARAAGADAILVGTALMRADDPTSLLRALASS